MVGCTDGKLETNFILKKIHDKASDADESATNSWKSNVLPALLQDYNSSCIYNCDETALYYRAMSDSTLCLKGGKVVGEKSRKLD